MVVRFSADRNVLDELSGEFPAGEISAIVGPSGCGKSTLLRVIAGLQSIQSGELRIDPVARAAAGEIAFVFQQPGYFHGVQRLKMSVCHCNSPKSVHGLTRYKRPRNN